MRTLFSTKVIVYLAYVIVALIPISNGYAQQFKTESGKIEFVSRASIETFSGTSNTLTGLIDLEKGSVDFYIDLNTIKTGIKLRDEHMRETYLETDKYPFAEFTGSMNGFNIAVADTQNVIVTGNFTIHGVSKPRTIRGRVHYSPESLYIDAAWEVLLSDHAIDIPKVLFLKLADNQQVTIQATLKPEKGQ